MRQQDLNRFKRILVDGYNVLLSTERYASLVDRRGVESSRAAMCADIAAAYWSGRVLVVFDGGGGEGIVRTRIGSVAVVYTKKGVSADEYIKKAAGRQEEPAHLAAVTSDRELAASLHVRGVTIIDSHTFAKLIEEAAGRRRAVARRADADDEVDDEPPEKLYGPGEEEVKRWMKIFGYLDDEEPDGR